MDENYMVVGLDSMTMRFSLSAGQVVYSSSYPKADVFILATKHKYLNLAF